MSRGNELWYDKRVKAPKFTPICSWCHEVHYTTLIKGYMSEANKSGMSNEGLMSFMLATARKQAYCQ